MKDQLSALMDGEFDVASSEHLITSVKSDGELKQSWASYHLIGDAMRGEAYLSHNFSGRVMDALATEPAVLAPKLSANTVSLSLAKNAGLKTSMKSTRFWSVAASVAAVMFVATMVLQQQFGKTDELSPVEIAKNLPVEYLVAHQAAAPSGVAYYIQDASYQNVNRKEQQQ
jgi:sigma-E factor negative regulatory protein RseA